MQKHQTGEKPSKSYSGGRKREEGGRSSLQMPFVFGSKEECVLDDCSKGQEDLVSF